MLVEAMPVAEPCILGDGGWLSWKGVLAVGPDMLKDLEEGPSSGGSVHWIWSVSVGINKL